MTTAEVALLVSAGSLIVSLLGFYFTHLRSGEINGSLGLAIHLYHPQDGGTGIYAHVHFINPTRIRSMVRRVVLEVVGPNGHRHYLAWQRRAKIEPNRDYTDVAGAAPFFVEPQAHSGDLFWFWWPDISHPLIFTTGEHIFRLHFWINKEQKPRASPSQVLVLSEDTVAYLKNKREARDPKTWIQSFDRGTSIGAFAEKENDEWWKGLHTLS